RRVLFRSNPNVNDHYFNILTNQYFIQLHLYFWKVWGSRFRRNWLRNSDRDYVLDGMPHICWYCIQSPSFSYVSSLYSVGKTRSEEHTSELQSRFDLVCRLL